MISGPDPTLLTAEPKPSLYRRLLPDPEMVTFKPYGIC
jgi:hypothetical protein